MIDLNASSRIMYEEAISMGIECTLLGDRETILMSKDGLQWYTRGSRTSAHSSVGKSLADNKVLTKKVLGHFDLPTSKFQVIKTAEDLDQLSKLTFPVVMKPINERHGKGVVVGIKSKKEAETAYQKTSGTQLFEEMLQGIEYRIVCVNFQFMAAAFRKPAYVVGDGTRTISALIEEKNKHPWRGTGHSNNLSIIEVDELVLELLASQGKTLDHIPAKNEEIILRKTANLSTGGEAWDVTESVCAENRQLFEEIARACDLSVIGIDIMCSSLSTPLTEQEKAGVIEVNASPGLRMHHFPLQGTPRNIAKAILDMTVKHIKLQPR